MHIPAEAIITSEMYIKIVPNPLLDGVVNDEGSSIRIAKPETNSITPTNEATTEIHWSTGDTEIMAMKNNTKLKITNRIPILPQIESRTSRMLIGILIMHH